jgi:hypothetical protein
LATILNVKKKLTPDVRSIIRYEVCGNELMF